MEFEEDKKTLKTINLEDFSIEDLEEYIQTLKLEIERASQDIKKRIKTKNEADVTVEVGVDEANILKKMYLKNTYPCRNA